MMWWCDVTQCEAELYLRPQSRLFFYESTHHLYYSNLTMLTFSFYELKERHPFVLQSHEKQVTSCDHFCYNRKKQSFPRKSLSSFS